ncbi:MAG: saccharopine dehydrogenase NADP-binding domain-containing protein [Anaerolineae bacterium]|nr:saccharopine dehydrogenase NADP-binding domain-containing protein [Anaerolineae bacterium]
MKIVVAGGAGMMGCIAVQDLARGEAVTELVIADRNLEAARQVAGYIASDKISLADIDVRDHEALVQALRGADCCLNAAAYYFNLDVMGACLEAGVHYADLGGLFHTTRKQWLLDDQFQAIGRSAVLGVGSAPGIPNVQARYAADLLDTVDTVRIYDGIRPPPPGAVAFTYAMSTILDELTLPPVVYRGGDFEACQPLGEPEDYCFSPPLGLLPVHLSLHSEVATLPLTLKSKGVREVVFKINYWGMAPDAVASIKALVDLGFASRAPVLAGETTVAPRDLLIALLGAHVLPILSFLEPPKSQPPDWAKEIVTEVRGARYGRPVTYRLATATVKGPLPTGAAASIVAQWLAEGRIPPGVHPPETALDPLPFFQELEKRGIPTQVSVTQPL